MKTERRDTPRIPIALEAILNFNRADFRQSKTRDISLDGVFVEGAQARVNKNQLIELAIRLPADGQQKFHRFQAQVIRTTEAGAALVFDRVDTDAYEALLRLVFSHQPKPLW